MTDHQRRLVEVEGDPGPAPRPRARSGVVAATAIGVVAMAAVLLSTRDTGGVEAVASTTTTTTTPTLGTVATPTTVVEPGAPPVPSKTSLGTLTWVEAEFKTSHVPQGEIQADPLLGGYVIHTSDGKGIWRSSDGLSWEKDDSPSSFGESEYVFYSGDYAFAEQRIYEIRSGAWAEMSLAGVPTPGADGLEWDIFPGMPVSSAEATLIPVSMIGIVPWGDIYGVESFDCGMAEPCESAPWAGWSSFSQRFEVHSNSSESRIATVEATVSGRRVILTDLDTDEVVHEIELSDRAEAESFLLDLDQGGNLLRPGALVLGDGDSEYRPLPWVGYHNLHGTDSGFVAFENFDYPGGTLEAPPRIWRSEDGRSWEDGGTVDFLPDRYQYAQVQTVNGQLVARVVTDWNPAKGENGFEEWVSSDGLDWTQRSSVLAPETWIQKANYGFMATGWVGFGPRFWVSADGESWEPISLPVARASDSSYYGTAGDLIYHSAVDPSGLGTLWIGRFVN